ncbi:MAG: MFS transporter [Chloroflexota bacterium]
MTESAPESGPSARWLTRNVSAFGWSSFFSDLGHELVTALIPSFLVSLGAPPIGLGLIEGVSNFGLSAAEIWGGRQADKIRNRVPLLDAGYLATMLKALIAVVPAWPWILLIRTVAWVGRGERGPVRNAMIADEVAREHWGKAYGFREALDTAGAVIGPLLVVLLIGHLQIRLLIGLSAIPAVISVIIVFVVVREIPHRLTQPPKLDLRPADYSPTFQRFLAGATLFAVGYVAPTFFILRATQLLHGHGGAAAISLAIALYTVHNFVYALMSYPAGALSDRISPRILLLGGYAIWVAVLVGFAAGSSSLIVLALLFIGSGAATAFISPVQTTWAAQLMSDESRGRGLGLLSGLSGFGQLISGILVGLVWTQATAAPAFIASAVLALLGLLLTASISPTATPANTPGA